MSIDDLIERMDGIPREPFKPFAMHTKEGNLLEIFWENVPYHAQWLNPKITLLKALDDERVIGCQVWGVTNYEEKKPAGGKDE